MDTLGSLTWGGVPILLEVLGWDEAFLTAGPGHADLGVPEEYAATVRATVLDATGLHCSVGIGDNKLRAKIATEFGKPRGDFRLTADNWFEVMGERPTRALWGIGSKTSQKLAALGIDTVRQLAGSDAHQLAEQLGPTMGRGTDGWGVEWAPAGWIRRRTCLGHTNAQSWQRPTPQLGSPSLRDHRVHDIGGEDPHQQTHRHQIRQPPARLGLPPTRTRHDPKTTPS